MKLHVWLGLDEHWHFNHSKIFKRCEMTNFTANTVINWEIPLDPWDNLVWLWRLTFKIRQTTRLIFSLTRTLKVKMSLSNTFTTDVMNLTFLSALFVLIYRPRGEAMKDCVRPGESLFRENLGKTSSINIELKGIKLYDDVWSRTLVKFLFLWQIQPNKTTDTQALTWSVNGTEFCRITHYENSHVSSVMN